MRFGFEGQGCFPTGKHYPGIAHLMRVAAAGLAEEFDAQTPLEDLPLVAIDTETTGRDPATDRIVEIACVTLKRGRVVEQRSWLINPERPIPKEAFDVHGISDEAVRDQPVFRQVLPELLAALSGLVPVAYNAEFDQRFVLAEIQRAGGVRPPLPPAVRPEVRWVDPLIWARALHQDAKTRSLGAMAELLGIQLEQAHRATDDAAAAALVMAKFFEDVRVPKHYGAFMHEQQRLSRFQSEQQRHWRNT